MRPERERERMLWELQTIRMHPHRIATALTTAINTLELIRLMLERWEKKEEADVGLSDAPGSGCPQRPAEG